MSEHIFSGRSLNECLEKASIKLNVSKENIQYKIIKEKKFFFKKEIYIEVIHEDLTNKVKSESIKTRNENSKVKIESSKSKNGSIKVENGNIIVEDPDKGGRLAILEPSDECKIIVEDIEIKGPKEVNCNSDIKVIFTENEEKRKINISFSEDNMKAYITTEYVPKKIFKIKDCSKVFRLKPEIEIKNQVLPERFTLKEIKEELITNGIKFGIIEENIEKSVKNSVKDLLVAKGKNPIPGIDDTIELKFKTEDEDKKFLQDNCGKIDYKSIGYVKTVKSGQVLAFINKGKDGKDGLDVKGRIKKHKVRKKISLKAGEGCEIKNNEVISATEGKPYVKNCVFEVHKVHEINGDVDLKTGNIKFTGDVIVRGNVKEGMKIDAGNNLFVQKNVERATLTSKSNMEINGNIINSHINSGGEELIKLEEIRNLKKIKYSIDELIETVKHIKEHNLLGENIKDGEIIKVLIENKFKCIVDFCMIYLKQNKEDMSEKEKVISNFMNEKLIGFGPLKIKNFLELNIFNKLVKKHIKVLNETLKISVDMTLNYCQDSILNSSGNIIITGKGEYVSNINANERVIFLNSSSIARGGAIKAEKEIKCRKVGSEGGVSTKLAVGNEGQIWVDVAYQNTCFIIGEREYTLDVPSREIHAYLNSKGELTVDKFIL